MISVKRQVNGPMRVHRMSFSRLERLPPLYGLGIGFIPVLKGCLLGGTTRYFVPLETKYLFYLPDALNVGGTAETISPQYSR